MPRKKHLVLVLLLVLILLVSAYVYITLKNGHTILNSDAPQQALLLSSVEQPEFVPSAYVRENTVREDMRASLIAQLKEYVPENQPAPVDEIEEAESQVVPEVPVLDIVRCVDSNSASTPIPSWGPINVVRTDTSRVIMSLRENDFGDPLHMLELPDTPRMQDESECLTLGMIGVALDGRVITPQTPFTADVEGLFGYAIDGFGIFGSVESGISLTSSSLDECHGHMHSIMWNGASNDLYHYHVTPDAPYVLGCFRGTPISTE
jgi:hypothetical protein